MIMFVLPLLSYWYDDLEPMIDAHTVELHYSKHHQTYCDKLNAWIKGTEYESRSLEQLLGGIDQLPDPLKQVVRNHGGGLYNHNVYRSTIKPGGSMPWTVLISLIEYHFGSRSEFETQFKTKASTLFGSWWTWLEYDGKDLLITNYPNQENPLMVGKTPLLWIDIREHAYYLNYQNRRWDYINGRRTLVDWDCVYQRYSQLIW